ncbi:MAG: hypothetical protein U1F61_11565 [Opitutaceae bacterium]
MDASLIAAESSRPVRVQRLQLGLRGFWLFAGLALLLSIGYKPVTNVRTLPPVASAPAEPASGGFRPEGVYSTTVTPHRLSGLKHWGSYLDSDAWQGRQETSWRRCPKGSFRVLVAGYPTTPGCSLTAEFRTVSGAALPSLVFNLPNPRESWQEWNIRPPPGAAEVRLTAVDAADSFFGWLGFSEPFEARNQLFEEGLMSLQSLSSWALAWTVLVGPWILWRSFSRLSAAPRPALDASLALGLGPALLALIGVATWCLSPWTNPIWTGGGAVAALWLGLGAGLLHPRFVPRLDRAETRILALCALVSLAGVAKAAYSGGPVGELYGGTISRTLEVGDRSDSRISFHGVQTLARGYAPTSAEAGYYFSPYSFFSRGPLAGLVAAPLVFATAGRPPAQMPDEPWSPFDQTGFAAYRIVLMVLACGVILVTFLVLRTVIPEALAVAGAGTLALCPFVVHEVFFTWPKLPATAWLIAAFWFGYRQTPLAAGAALAVGYFFHPLAALWAPWLVLWCAGCAFHRPIAEPHRLREAARSAARSAAIPLVAILGWMLAGRLAPQHGVHQGQADFLLYWFKADAAPADLRSWIASRWDNFANTFIPFWLHLVNRSHGALNSISGPSDSWTKFAFSWWTTLPLGLGLAPWTLAMVTLIRCPRRLLRLSIPMFLGPALFLVLYWGGSTTGLMREAGHPLLAGLVLFVFLELDRSGRGTALVRHPAWPVWQLPETLLMCWLTTWNNPAPLLGHPVSDTLWWLAHLAALLSAALVVAGQGNPTDPPTSPARTA